MKSLFKWLDRYQQTEVQDFDEVAGIDEPQPVSLVPAPAQNDNACVFTISEVIEKCYQSYINDRRTNDTPNGLTITDRQANDYKYDLNEVGDIIGKNITSDKVNPDFIDTAIGCLKDQTDSDDKFKRLRGKFKAILKYGNKRMYWFLREVDEFFPAIPEKKGAKVKGRKPFDKDDLNKLLYGTIFNKDATSTKRAEIYHYWYFVALLFTGARPQEIGQLRVQDIIEDPETGIYYFNLTEEIDEAEPNDLPNSLKNANAWRKIPIHDRLIELGFFKWLEFVKKYGA